MEAVLGAIDSINLYKISLSLIIEQEESKMRLCPICGGEPLEGKPTTYAVDFKHTLLVVRDVPADVCSRCCTKWFLPDITSKLEKITNEVREKKPDEHI